MLLVSSWNPETVWLFGLVQASSIPESFLSGFAKTAQMSGLQVSFINIFMRAFCANIFAPQNYKAKM